MNTPILFTPPASVREFLKELTKLLLLIGIFAMLVLFLVAMNGENLD